MKTNEGNHVDIENVTDGVDLIEDEIELFVQQQYIDFSKKIDFDSYDYKQVLKEGEKLFSEDTAFETKQIILLRLAHLGTIDSYRTIERYLRLPENNLRDWALLSLKECGMFLQNSFLSEEGGLLSTGLGGKGNKLRYYFVLRTKKGLPFSEKDRDMMHNVFKMIARQFESDIEELFLEKNYAMVKILIPMDVAVGTVIDEGIIECNKKQEFLAPSYYVTNVKKPTNEEIMLYLEEAEREC